MQNRIRKALGKFQPGISIRHSYHATFPWPKNLFFLKRCFIEQQYHMSSGKELVIVNLHNSTFDENGKLRMAELKQLKEFIDSEWSKMNYIVIGGDWNMNPRGFLASGITTGDIVQEITPGFDLSFLPGWQFAFDPARPTNRNVDKPYVKGKTKTTIIDFFVVSPNITVLSVQTLSTGFMYSDHQPVRMKIRLN